MVIQNAIDLTLDGLISHDGDGVLTPRVITGVANEIVVVDGDSISADPTLSLASEIHIDSQSFDSGSNLLQNYVSNNSFTPVLDSSNVSPDSVTYSKQEGSYLRIGNIAQIQLEIALSAFTLGSGTGQIRITGLPFTSPSNGTTNSAFGIRISNLDLDAGILMLIPNVAENQAELNIGQSRDDQNFTSVLIAAVNSNTIITIEGWYFIQ